MVNEELLHDVAGVVEFCSLDSVSEAEGFAPDPFDILAEREREANVPLAFVGKDDLPPMENMTTVINPRGAGRFNRSSTKEMVMNLHSVVCEMSHGFEAQGRVLQSADIWARIRIKKEIFRLLKAQDAKTTVFDDSRLAELGVLPNQIEGTERDTGKETVEPDDIHQIVRGWAATFILLARHCMTPSPVDGKRPTHRQETLTDFDGLIAEMAKWQATSGKEAGRVRAECKKVGVSPDARLAAIRKSNEARFAAAAGAMHAEYKAALAEQKNADADELANVIEDMLADHGEQPQAFVVQVGKAHVEFCKRRANDGLYFVVDDGLYALAQSA